MKNKLIIIFFTIFSLSLCAEQLKLFGNLIMLSVSEENGRFTLYQRNSKQDKWRPLIFEDFPSTTYFRFFDKDYKIINFGQGGKDNYSETKIVDDTIVYFWQNRELKIKLIYKLVPSKKGDSSDTLLIDLFLLNLTDNDLLVNYYFCIDTFLGEKSNKHFLLPGSLVIDNEKEILSEAIPLTLTSFDPNLKYGINILFGKEKQNKPSRIFFANWKKVEQTNGFYKVEFGKNFDMKPYSLNDSAIFIDYKDKNIKANSDITNRFILSMSSDVFFSEEKSDTKEIVKIEEVKKEEKKEEIKDLEEEHENKGMKLKSMSLSELLKLLDKINKKLSSGEKLTEEDVMLSKHILSEIKKRKGKKTE